MFRDKEWYLIVVARILVLCLATCAFFSVDRPRAERYKPTGQDARLCVVVGLPSRDGGLRLIDLSFEKIRSCFLVLVGVVGWLV